MLRFNIPNAGAGAMDTSASVAIEPRSAHGAIRAELAPRMRGECLSAHYSIFTENSLRDLPDNYSWEPALLLCQHKIDMKINMFM